MTDSYIYLYGERIPKSSIAYIGTYAEDVQVGVEYEPAPMRSTLDFLAGGFVGGVLEMLASTKEYPVIERFSYLVLTMADGTVRRYQYGEGCGTTERDVKKMLKDFKKHREIYAP